MKPGDLFVYRKKSCAEHLDDMTRDRSTFASILRGFETGEFCPEQLCYVLVMRNPLQRMDSFASLYKHVLPIPELMARLEAGEWRGGQGVDTHFVWSRSDPQQSHMGIGANLSAARWHNGSGYGMATYDNLVVRCLAGLTEVLHAPLGSITRAHYDMARATLSRFGLAMTLEDATPHDYEGFPLYWRDFEFATNTSNTGYNHHATHTFTPAQAHWFARRNVWDMKLWESLWVSRARHHQGDVG